MHTPRLVYETYYEGYWQLCGLLPKVILKSSMAPSNQLLEGVMAFHAALLELYSLLQLSKPHNLDQASTPTFLRDLGGSQPHSALPYFTYRTRSFRTRQARPELCHVGVAAEGESKAERPSTAEARQSHRRDRRRRAECRKTLFRLRYHFAARCALPVWQIRPTVLPKGLADLNIEGTKSVQAPARNIDGRPAFPPFARYP